VFPTFSSISVTGYSVSVHRVVYIVFSGVSWVFSGWPPPLDVVAKGSNFPTPAPHLVVTGS
jgi:hypothetical protein